jgi:hypothetical protein
LSSAVVAMVLLPHHGSEFVCAPARSRVSYAIEPK